MHILYLHQYFVPPDGNGGTRSYEMARRLVRAGHQVTLITSSAFLPEHYLSEGTISILEIDGIKLIVLKVAYSNRLAFGKRILAFLKFALGTIFEVIKLKNIDVVFATSTPLTIALPGIVAKWKHNCPMVFEVRDLWPELPVAVGAIKNPFLIRLAQWLERLAYQHSARIVALSPGMAAGIKKRGYPEENISIIPNSCDLDLFRVSNKKGKIFFEEYPYLSDGPLVVYSGTLGAINGVSYLAEIAYWSNKFDASVRFLVVGDGIESELIKQKAAELGVLNKNFWMLPPIPKSEIPKLLSAASMATSFVIDLPELWNNSANKFFDALAAGRPLMINHQGWQADILAETGAGIVVPPDDPKRTAKLLLDFLSDKSRIEGARKAAEQLSDTVFNRDELASKLLKCIEDAVSHS